MRRTLTLLLAALVVALAGCGGGAGGEDDGEAQTPIDAETTNVDTAGEAEGATTQLEPQGDNGQSGEVSLKPAGQQGTLVVVRIDQPAEDNQTVHIHRGRCPGVAADAAVEHELDPVGENPSETEVNAALDDLLEGGLAVTVHGVGGADAEHTACADLAGPAE